MNYKQNSQIMKALVDITIDNKDLDAALRLKILDAATFASELMDLENELDLLE